MWLLLYALTSLLVTSLSFTELKVPLLCNVKKIFTNGSHWNEMRKFSWVDSNIFYCQWDAASLLKQILCPESCRFLFRESNWALMSTEWGHFLTDAYKKPKGLCNWSVWSVNRMFMIKQLHCESTDGYNFAQSVHSRLAHSAVFDGDIGFIHSLFV